MIAVRIIISIVDHQQPCSLSYYIQAERRKRAAVRLPAWCCCPAGSSCKVRSRTEMGTQATLLHYWLKSFSVWKMVDTCWLWKACKVLQEKTLEQGKFVELSSPHLTRKWESSGIYRIIMIYMACHTYCSDLKICLYRFILSANSYHCVWCQLQYRKYQGCSTFWHLWATLEEEELSWVTH